MARLHTGECWRTEKAFISLQFHDWLSLVVCFHKAQWEERLWCKTNFLSGKQKESPLSLSFRSDLWVRKHPCLEWPSRCLHDESAISHFSHPAVWHEFFFNMNYFIICDQILDKMVYYIMGSAHVISLLCIIHLNSDRQLSCNMDVK